METTVAVETLESVSDRLTALRNKQQGLHWALDRLAEKNSRLVDERRSLLIRGDATAIARAVEVEAALGNFAREAEGLNLRLNELDAPIASTERERAAMLQAAAAEYRARRAELVSAEVEKQTHNVVALYRSGCRAEYELCEYLRLNVVHSQDLTETQKAEIIGKVRQGLRPPDRWNEAWPKSSCDIGRANLTTINACPPDELRHLESLK